MHEVHSPEQKNRQTLMGIEARLLELQKVVAHAAPNFSGFEKALLAARQEGAINTFNAGAVVSTLHDAADAWPDTANLPVTLDDWRIALNQPGGSAGAVLEKLRWLNGEFIRQPQQQAPQAFSARLAAAYGRLTTFSCDVRDALAAVALLEEGKAILGR